ncbi:hypothetical protein NYR30_04160 [Gallibacterium salpingitidis]|uniref:hypothetical protein n=1 Tax=Gallibacterium salpingitidis TaxID=505341 RepID=UPI00266F0AB2|nr:hypothetical protein [Gallibacterium salpingitidis]WKT00488.1 hypothetical protein NYR30_04160 [Gallibacterium salpingitidis]
MNEKSEVIVCAAIKFNCESNKLSRELVIPMVRHYSPDAHRVLNTIEEFYKTKQIEQGFITNFSRYVDRKEALKIAKANNQIKHDIGYEPDELYSEMLY